MRLVRSLNTRRENPPATSVAVGNFDGLHRGHQALIDVARACEDKLVPALMCFEPLPATFFKPDEPQRRVMNLRDRIRLTRDYGIERMFLMRFDKEFARQSPERFVRDVLVRGAGAKRVVVGADFRFGSRAAGDVAMLRKLGQRYGFEVECVESVETGDERVSSSRIREALGQGDLDQAERLLGRPYAISGRVLRGRALGRDLGYPTANIRPPSPPALSGVTAVRVHGAGLDGHPAVASLGRRPVLGGTDWLLEAHLFDYDGNLYGEHLEIEFVEYLRPEAPFEDLDSLTEQMRKDEAQARAILLPET
jgi:riboflavin kinase/FMN adenylyltransferase